MWQGGVSPGTFGNYLSHLRGACHAMGFEAPPTGHPAMKRAMVAIAKRELFEAREKRFIDRYSFALHPHDRASVLWVLA